MGDSALAWVWISVLVVGGICYGVYRIHEQGTSWLVIGLVVLHVAAIIYYRFAKRQNLVTAMLTGDKTLEVALTASRDGVADRLKALLVLALAAGVVWWVVSLGGAKP